MRRPWDQDWSPYYDAQTRTEPREVVVAALEAAGPSAGRLAVDLGCGLGVDTLAMLAAGWRVHAVDGSADGLSRLRAAAGERDDLTLVQSRLEDVEVPSAGLIHAGYVWPFCPPAHFDAFWERMRAALEPGGVLVGHLFGPRDTWAGQVEDMTFHDAEAVAALFAGLDVLSLVEIDEDGASAAGPKHWHVFEVLARAPS